MSNPFSVMIAAISKGWPKDDVLAIGHLLADRFLRDDVVIGESAADVAPRIVRCPNCNCAFDPVADPDMRVPDLDPAQVGRDAQLKADADAIRKQWEADDCELAKAADELMTGMAAPVKPPLRTYCDNCRAWHTRSQAEQFFTQPPDFDLCDATCIYKAPVIPF